MYVVTGGAGFIGSVVLAELNAQGIDDILVVDHLGETEKWRNLLGKSYSGYMHKDTFLPALEKGRYRNIMGIIHLGACSSTTATDGDYIFQNNFSYSVRLAEHCRYNNIRFVYASSAATYGDGEKGYSDADDIQHEYRPLNLYGYSKQLFDLWVLKNELQDDCAGLKFFNVYGPNEYHKESMRSVVLTAYEQLVETGSIRLFRSYRDDYADGEQKRDFIYVKDCAKVVVWLLLNDAVNGIFNLGTGVARSWNDLAAAVCASAGKEKQIEYIDMPESLRKQYQYFTQADMSKLHTAKCPVQFHSLEEGVRDYVECYLCKGLGRV